jgi:hypothetical protein
MEAENKKMEVYMQEVFRLMEPKERIAIPQKLEILELDCLPDLSEWRSE